LLVVERTIEKKMKNNTSTRHLTMNHSIHRRKRISFANVKWVTYWLIERKEAARLI